MRKSISLTSQLEPAKSDNSIWEGLKMVGRGILGLLADEVPIDLREKELTAATLAAAENSVVTLSGRTRFLGTTDNDDFSLFSFAPPDLSVYRFDVTDSAGNHIKARVEGDLEIDEGTHAISGRLEKDPRGRWILRESYLELGRD